MEKKEILVSIIVPVYGTEAYLPACIDSIRCQSHPNLQIILVDDQSPDGCPEICDRYARMDERIMVIHQKNKGVSGARNTGLERASGDYIMFVDSDDKIYPDAVEILLHDALFHGADIVSADQGGDAAIRETERRYGENDCRVYRGEGVVRLALEGRCFTPSACSKLFRSRLLCDVRFEEGKSNHEDGFFFFQCCMKKPTVVQRDVAVYQYNFREGSGSRGAFSDKYLAMLYFCQRKKELVEAHYPQYMEERHNMEVRTNLEFLDVLCRTTDKKYKKIQRQCVRTVCRLFRYHKPINGHHRQLARIVKFGLYPLYKWAVRMKYYRSV